MLITKGSPEDIYRWFVQGEFPSSVLCIALSDGATGTEPYKELIDRQREIDRKIGRHLSLLLCVSGDSAHGKSLNAFGGVAVQAKKFLASGEYKELLVESGGSQDDLAEDVDGAVDDLIDFFNVPSNKLPSIVVLIRGIEGHFNVPLRNGFDIVDFVKSLSDVAVKVKDVYADSGFDELKRERNYIIQSHSTAKEVRKDVEVLNGYKNKIRRSIRNLCHSNKVSEDLAVDLEDISLDMSLSWDEKIQRIGGNLINSQNGSLAIRDSRMAELRKLFAKAQVKSEKISRAIHEDEFPEEFHKARDRKVQSVLQKKEELVKSLHDLFNGDDIEYRDVGPMQSPMMDRRTILYNRLPVVDTLSSVFGSAIAGFTFFQS